MPERVKELFDGLTVAFGLSAGSHFVGSHFANVKLDRAMTVSIGVITILLGICKLYEFLTGRKVHQLFRKKDK